MGRTATSLGSHYFRGRSKILPRAEGQKSSVRNFLPKANICASGTKFDFSGRGTPETQDLPLDFLGKFAALAFADKTCQTEAEQHTETWLWHRSATSTSNQRCSPHRSRCRCGCRSESSCAAPPPYSTRGPSRASCRPEPEATCRSAPSSRRSLPTSEGAFFSVVCGV